MAPLPDDLIVVGAGKMRTGTTSLKLALEILLKAPCYHMKEAVSHPSHIPFWIKAVDNNGLDSTEWRTVFKGYRATVDYPGCPFFLDILKTYPNAKVILSLREPHSWVRSVRETVAYAAKSVNQFPLNFFFRFTPLYRLPELLKKCSEVYIKMSDVERDESYAVTKFNEWNDHVKASIPADQLLVFEAREGWEPLCKFLNLPIPSVPYPHANKSGDIQNFIKLAKVISYTFVFGLPIVISSAIIWFITK